MQLGNHSDLGLQELNNGGLFRRLTTISARRNRSNEVRERRNFEVPDASQCIQFWILHLD
jgi:hypothetical protein